MARFIWQDRIPDQYGPDFARYYDLVGTGGDVVVSDVKMVLKNEVQPDRAGTPVNAANLNNLDQKVENALATYGVCPYANSQTFNSSGTWRCPAGVTKVDVWLVGGGGSSQYDNYVAYGGGGGYTRLVQNITVSPNSNYSVAVGAGGSGPASGNGTFNLGGQSSAFGYSVYGGNYPRYMDGGSGGGLVGGRNGGHGSRGQNNFGSGTTSYYCGIGQGASTINPYNGIMYGGGGSSYVLDQIAGTGPVANPYNGDNGGGGIANGDGLAGTNGRANSGGGGGGKPYNSSGSYSSSAGGSGCVIIYSLYPLTI
ncbi:hypothetical protein FACS1894171_2450 [Clostridia bacterium]|nr:hypothetical protein FACS1894171_2450 [Clostridia bacterium]